MEIAYACTFEDFVEAQRAHRTPSPGERPSVWERLLFVWVLLATLALALAVLIGAALYTVAAGMPPGTPSVVAPYLVSIVTPWLMWMVVFALLWFGFALALPRAERRTVRWFLLLVLGFVLMLNVIDAVINGPQPAARNDAPRDEGGSVIATLTPWVVIFLVLWFFVFRFVRGAIRRSWDAQPQLRLPHALETTDRGLRFVIDGGRTWFEGTWPAFVKFRESQNLFLIYVSDIAFEMVPKRAFADAAGVEAFRQLLAARVPTDTPSITGFPVLPPRPAIPPAATAS